MKICLEKVSEGINVSDIIGIGITNQWETTVAWDWETGNTFYDAIVWLDKWTTDIADDLIKEYGVNGFWEITGLPINTYFSAVKILWMLQNVPRGKKID